MACTEQYQQTRLYVPACEKLFTNPPQITRVAAHSFCTLVGFSGCPNAGVRQVDRVGQRIILSGAGVFGGVV